MIDTQDEVQCVRYLQITWYSSVKKKKKYIISLNFGERHWSQKDWPQADQRQYMDYGVQFSEYESREDEMVKTEDNFYCCQSDKKWRQPTTTT